MNPDEVLLEVLKARDSMKANEGTEDLSKTTTQNDSWNKKLEDILGELYNSALNNYMSPLEWHEEALASINQLVLNDLIGPDEDTPYDPNTGYDFKAENDRNQLWRQLRNTLGG